MSTVCRTVCRALGATFLRALDPAWDGEPAPAGSARATAVSSLSDAEKRALAGSLRPLTDERFHANGACH